MIIKKKVYVKCATSEPIIQLPEFIRGNRGVWQVSGMRRSGCSGDIL